ncbi:hypothetical protein N8714_00480 [Rhodobacteraceae bacterium]|nr:hypothetical protein [Paracoccaceae bacterium]
MKNECHKCKVVHNSLAKSCFNCGDTLDKYKTKSFVVALPTLLATTALSLTAAVSDFNFGGGS